MDAQGGIDSKKTLIHFYIAMDRVGYFQTVSLIQLDYGPDIGGDTSGGS